MSALAGRSPGLAGIPHFTDARIVRATGTMILKAQLSLSLMVRRVGGHPVIGLSSGPERVAGSEASMRSVFGHRINAYRPNGKAGDIRRLIIGITYIPADDIFRPALTVGIHLWWFSLTVWIRNGGMKIVDDSESEGASE